MLQREKRLIFAEANAHFYRLSGISVANSAAIRIYAGDNHSFRAAQTLLHRINQSMRSKAAFLCNNNMKLTTPVINKKKMPQPLPSSIRSNEIFLDRLFWISSIEMCDLIFGALKTGQFCSLNGGWKIYAKVHKINQLSLLPMCIQRAMQWTELAWTRIEWAIWLIRRYKHGLSTAHSSHLLLCAH